jgi:hypothetical protein
MSGHAEGTGEDDSVWQGYVSAIACLLLALLLLMSILALAIVLGSAAGQEEAAGDAAKATEKSAQNTTGEKPQSIAGQAAVKASATSGNVDLAPQWVLRFPKDTWRFTDSQRAELAAQFANANANTGAPREWRAWVQMPQDKADGNTTEGGSSREAYLRLLAVRDLLIAAGVKPGQIDLRILSEVPPGKPALEASDTTVLLARRVKAAQSVEAINQPIAASPPGESIAPAGEAR